MEGLFFAAGFVNEAEPLGLGEGGCVEGGGIKSHFGEEMIKNVAAEGGYAFAGEDGVGAVIEFDERRVEGTAAEIVDEDRILAGGFFAVGVSVLDGGGGGFVEQADDVEAGVSKGFDGEEALVRVGAGGDAEHDFEGLAGGEFEVGMITEGGEEGGGKIVENQGQRGDLAGDIDRGLGTSGGEKSFEAANDGGVGIRLGGPGVPAVDTATILDTGKRREPVTDLAIGGFKGDDRVIAAIRRGNDDAGCAEIDTQPHPDRITGMARGRKQ